METVYIVLLLGPYLEGTDSAGTPPDGPAETKLTVGVGLRSKCDFFVPFVREESLDSLQCAPRPSLSE